MKTNVYERENPPGRIVAYFLRLISEVIDRVVVGAENASKGGVERLSKRLELPEYNQSEFFENPETFYDRGLNPPDVDVTPRHSLGGIRVSHFKFQSETKSDCAENDVVRGRAFDARKASGAKDAPTAVITHGWREGGAFTPYYYLLGWLMARAGINCLFITQPFHGPRKPRDGIDGDLMLCGDMERTITSFRQSVGDVRSLVTWARERFDGPVGVMGISLGGFVTMLVACVDERVDFAVPIISSGDIIEGVWDGIVGRSLVRDFKKVGLDVEAVQRNWRIISPVHFRPKLPPEKIQLIAARYDLLIPAANVARLWEEWDKPRLKWLYSGHISIFLFPRVLLKTIVGFIKEITSG